MVAIDRDLLFIYSENARMRLKILAKALKKTPQRLKYTLTNLEKEGIVRAPHCIFDYSYLGLLLFRVYFKGGYISENDKLGIIKKLSEHPYVTSIYELTGEFDLALEFIAPNPSRFNKELKTAANLIPTLNNYKIILNVVTHVYPRQYLPKSKELGAAEKPEIIVGGDRAVDSFTKNELDVMKQLLMRPKMRRTAMAKVTRLNIKTVTSVVRQLQKRKIIKGFKYAIDANALGFEKARLFLNLHNISKEREAQLLGFLLRTPEVVQVHKTVGDWEMEIDIETLDKNRMRYLIILIREEFKDIIESFNLIEFYQYYKRSYLPMYLFMPELPQQQRKAEVQERLQKWNVSKGDANKSLK
ncbi:MAG TPA: Lrp/AsnC family transcriptional regulator [Candidatus Nanoarchaeia archaeon]|nr:Lrp/AsnC family transcriptional regulator [Candidatus Nanoarchaeia archaeon]